MKAVSKIKIINCNLGNDASSISKGGAVAIIQDEASVITKFSKNIADIEGAILI